MEQDNYKIRRHLKINIMPKELEQKLIKEANKKGLSKERMGAYVYGTLRKTGWVPSTQRRKNKRITSKSFTKHKLK